jgi:hypothetical protein
MYTPMMRSAGAVVAACLAGCATAGFASPDELRSLLTQTEIRFSTDGCGGSDTLGHPEIRQFIESHPETLIRGLIDLLPSAAETRARVNGVPGVRLGTVAFDLLCTLLEATRWFNEEWAGCGYWTAVYPEYFIPLEPAEFDRTPVLAVQRKWRALLEAGDLRIGKYE